MTADAGAAVPPGARPLGFVGLGVMGAALCRHAALAGGRPVLVHDRRPDAVAALTGLEGARVEGAGSLRELAAAEIVFLSLPTEAEVREVLLGPGGIVGDAAPGLVVADMSTVPVDGVGRLAAALAERGVTYVDAPIAGTAESVGRRDVLVMVGAPDDAFARLEPFLRAMAEKVLHCGPVGAGATVKLLNNVVLAETVVALAEALTLARAAGIAAGTLFEALSRGADSFALRQHGMTALLPDSFPEGRFPTRYMLKDVAGAVKLAESHGLRPAGMRLARDLLARTADMGLADAYWPALVRAVEKGEPD